MCRKSKLDSPTAAPFRRTPATPFALLLDLSTVPLRIVGSVLLILLPASTPNAESRHLQELKHAQEIEHSKHVALTRFFSAYDAPAPYYISDYLSAAKKHKLDYRLLPAISMIESGAGKHPCRDGRSRWGYGNCKGNVFATVEEGIEHISAALENGTYYRGKTLEQKLKQYNPENPRYPAVIMGLMAEIHHANANLPNATPQSDRNR